MAYKQWDPDQRKWITGLEEESSDKKLGWLQKLTQYHKEASVARQVQAGQNRLEGWQKSQRKKGYGPEGKVEGPVSAADPNQPKTQTKPKPASKKSNIPGWMQRKIDRRYAQYDAIYGDAVTNKEGKLVSKKQLKKDHLEEMDDLVSTLGKSQIPYTTEGLETPYTPDELAVVQSKNVAFKMQFDKALKRYNELADLYDEPRFGDKAVKEKKKKGNGENGDKPVKYDFSDPKLEITPDLIKNIIAGADSTQNAQLDSAMTAKLPALKNNQNIVKAGEDTSWFGDALKKLVNPVGEKQKEQASTKQKTAERKSIIAKARKAGHQWTQKELYQYNKTGVLPGAVKKLLNKSK